VYGERKKSHDKVYPKGYVEMLEAQQTWLVNGLQSMYTLLDDANMFPGGALDIEDHGRPLTHDVLERLAALPTGEHFEEDCEELLERANSIRVPEAPVERKPTARSMFSPTSSTSSSSSSSRRHREHSSRSRSPDTDRSYSPPSHHGSLRASFENSPRTPLTPANMDFQYWQMQQAAQGFGGMPETKPINMATAWGFQQQQPLPDAQIMWPTSANMQQGMMIPELTMDMDTTFFDTGLTGPSLVINPVSLSDSSDSADFENFLHSGL